MYDINQLRTTEFPSSKDIIFMNHASISPLPKRTQDRVKWAIDGFAQNPSKFWSEQGMAYTERLHHDVAATINAQAAREIAPVPTTGYALNMVAQSINWQPGDNILFCDIEFPANAYPWLSLARDGVEVRLVPAANGGLTLAAIKAIADENTRLIAASALQFFSGHRTDLTAVGAFCHENNILFVVDAIQAIGHMKIDVQAAHIDVLASGGQKSLLATPGQGFIYVREAVAEQMRPRFIGGNATQNFLHWLNYDLTPAAAAGRFASGTPNIPGITAVVESLGLLNELGIDNIDQHTRSLSEQMITMLTQMGYEVITSRPAPGPIVTFKLEMSNQEADALVAKLAQQNVIVVKHLDRAGNPHLRTSFHCYNTHEEVAQFGEILAGIGI